MIQRFIIIVLDGFGVGELPDSKEYKDEGSNTLKHIYENSDLNIPNLVSLGLFNIDGIQIPNKKEQIKGCYGKAEEMSAGKNSPVGHWEISGYINRKPFSTYPNGFPENMLQEFCQKTGIEKTIYNGVGSGTELLKQYGEEHIKTGYPIIYTSADSVFQIAAHENIISVDKLYQICKIAREMLNKPEYNIGTVIARPFIGDNKDNFTRTYNRKDFESDKFGTTMLDKLKENGKDVITIGKIEDLFSGRGITKAIHTQGNADGIEKTIQEIQKDSKGLIFTNLVDFDMLYGHRNDLQGYKNALEYFDSKLPEIMQNMKEEDVLIVTADHGNDPYTPSTDHSREYIPILVYGEQLKENINLGTRKTYADISATILETFGIEKLEGESFQKEII